MSTAEEPVHVAERQELSDTTRPTDIWVGALIVTLVALPAIVKLLFYPAYPGSDDAFIHTAVAQHVLDGQGWGIESIDAVNLSSSPVFTVLLLPILAIGSIGLAQIVFMAFACAGLALTYAITRRLTNSTNLAVAGLAVAACNVHLWRWSGTIMEATVGFFAVLVIVAGTLRLHRSNSGILQLFILGVAIGIGTLVRFEIGLFLPLSIATIWLSQRTARARTAAWITGGFLVAIAPWLIFASAYFGSPIPTTFGAKASRLHLVNIDIIKQIGSVFISGFSFSIVIAAAALVFLLRSNEGREALAAQAAKQALLLGWPIGLFAFYYIKTDGLQSAARYFLPGMATWPIAFALLLSAVPAAVMTKYRVLLWGGIVGCLLVALTLNVVQVRPVLTNFNSEYRSTMAQGATFLRDNCQPGDTALIKVDIGVMADDGIGECTLADAGTLASPELRGLSFQEMIDKTNPAFVVESIGKTQGGLGEEHPELRLVLSREYTSHGVSKSGQVNWLNIYEVAAP